MSTAPARARDSQEEGENNDKDMGSAKKHERIPQGTAAERLDVPSSEANKGVLNELVGESSAPGPVPGAQADVVATGAEADEASCPNQDSELICRAAVVGNQQLAELGSQDVCVCVCACSEGIKRLLVLLQMKD
ncbi:rbcG [Symbiodinium sp. CCMP2592]|nr:rbcG [Symbiodinium sp. CCMP2592]